jgi:hypothetical protein
VLEYIPELQKQVDTLEKKKEKLTRASCKPGVLTMKENRAPIVSATCLDDRDIMVQVSLLSNMVGALPMSKCIKVLENEGLRLISSSTSPFQSRTLYSLHLQVSAFPIDVCLVDLNQWHFPCSIIMRITSTAALAIWGIIFNMKIIKYVCLPCVGIFFPFTYLPYI